MPNPFVKVDLTDYERLHPSFRHVWQAELLMINTNKGTIRARIYDDKRNLVAGNLDLPMDVIVDNQFTVKVR